MPRPPRNDYDGKVVHLTARAVLGEVLFSDDLDRHAYLAGLVAAAHRGTSGAVLDYCLMPNHVHLLVRSTGSTSLTLHRLNGRFAQAINDRHGRRGHLFDGRYKSQPVAQQTHLEQVYGYIAHNPVKAGLCRGPLDFAWSGAAALAGLASPAPFHDVDAALGFLAEDGGAARERYRRLLRQRLTSPA